MYPSGARRARGALVLAVRDPGVAHDVARGGAHVGLPAGALVGAAAGVEAQAGDDHERVAALGVDRDPRALAGLAPALEAGGVERLVEHPGAVEGVGHRARAVVAGVLPPAVPAAVLVRLLGDAVAGLDDRLDERRRVGGGDREAVRADDGLAGGGHRERLAGAGLDGDAERLGVGPRDAAVDLAGLLGLPGADLASRAAAELAVDGGLEARAGQVVLEDADVTSMHPLMQRTLPEDPLGGRRGGDRYGHEPESH